MRKIRVLQVASGLNLGGYERVVANLCEHMDRDRFEVSVLCTKFLGHFGAKLRDSGFDVTSFESPEGKSAGLKAPLYALRHLRRGRYDVVHTHGTSALLDVGPIMPLIRGSRFVHTYHFGNYPNRPFHYLLLEGIFSRFPDQLVAVSHFQREAIATTFKIGERKIRTIWNGVDLDHRLNDVDGVKASLGIEEDTLVVGTIANIIEQKGYEYFLAVADDVCSRIPNVVFVAVGGGPLEEQIRSKAAKSAYADRIKILGYRSDATEILGVFDVFLLASLWEAMPIVLLEAMACSKPIVATDVGDNARMVEHGTAGYITEPRDTATMSSRLLEMLRSESLRRSMGENGGTRYRSLFTADVMVSEYASLFETVARDTSAAG